MRLKILIIFLFVFSLFFFDSALAIGIGAKPSFLDLELKVGQPQKTKILVYNISQEAGIFQVFSDELNEWIKIEPNSFRLEAGENKEVKIKVLAKEEGKKATNLSVLVASLDRRSFSVGPGLKIPLRLNVREGESIFLASLLAVFSRHLPWLIVGILVICLIGFFLLKYLKKRKKVIPPPANLPVSSD
ncbi:hypothetical protein KJA14_01465 [Patescibacteria group bacterium]|nr:hypothetical protein [Patescibacteria group bacterium]